MTGLALVVWFALARPGTEEVAAAPPPAVAERAMERPEAVAEIAPERDGIDPSRVQIPVVRPEELAARERKLRSDEERTGGETVPGTGMAAREDVDPRVARLGPRLNRAEATALRLGVKRYFVYSGDRTDPELSVVIGVELAPDGSLIGKPVILDGTGGTEAAQRALGQAGIRAILRADRAREFARLPAEKYEHWRTMRLTFGIDSMGLTE